MLSYQYLSATLHGPVSKLPYPHFEGTGGTERGLWLAVENKDVYLEKQMSYRISNQLEKVLLDISCPQKLWSIYS